MSPTDPDPRGPTSMTTPAPECPDCGTDWSTDCPRNRPAGSDAWDPTAGLVATDVSDVSRAHSAPLLVSIP